MCTVEQGLLHLCYTSANSQQLFGSMPSEADLCELSDRMRTDVDRKGKLHLVIDSGGELMHSEGDTKIGLEFEPGISTTLLKDMI